MSPTQIELSQFNHYLTPRPRDWHKGNAGHVLIIGGARGFTGAPRMAAEAALRVGAGLVTIAAHSEQADLLNIFHPEIMSQGVDNPEQLEPLIEKASVVVIGPGLGQTPWAKSLLTKTLATTLPLIVDADALNLLAAIPAARTNWILTPHPGEAGRLLHKTAEAVQHARLEAVKQLQSTYSGIAVLKGAGSLIACSNEEVFICTAGNPGMATGGMGDVLSGILGGLAAQGIPLDDAAKLGVCLHAAAGDLAARAKGERGTIATDLMPYLHQLVNP